MGEHGLEQLLRRLFKQDFSAGTEEFRNELLKRCLKALGSDDASANDAIGCAELTDADLELLAAAGEPFLRHDAIPFNDDETPSNSLS